MKTVALAFLTFYKNILSPLLHQLLGIKTMCRYKQSCSEYTKEAIATDGVVTGIGKGMKRVLSCQPFNTNNATL